MMNKYKILKYKFLAIFLVFGILLSNCEEEITDFGYDGHISGKVEDQSGNLVSGDVTSENLTVYVLAEDEREPIRIRVKGDGSYENTSLYPQKYTIWIDNGIVPSDELTVDLTDGPVSHDFTVTPFLTISNPSVDGSPSSNEVTVSYNISENEGYEVEERVVYVSTVSYPSHTTGSGPYWETISQELPDNQGSITVEGLSSNTDYFIRVAARAKGSSHWNLSGQVEITTP